MVDLIALVATSLGYLGLAMLAAFDVLELSLNPTLPLFVLPLNVMLFIWLRQISSYKMSNLANAGVISLAFVYFLIKYTRGS